MTSIRSRRAGTRSTGALASGRPAVTAPIRLVQEQRERPGVLVLAPALPADQR
ncbi:CHASE domain-containing protein [uncultured Propionivibrio sp.]|uniref:CHASE domain-containing protein n=1 Tax=uncultured Propionivibrio sp. TaxID=426737 RepID=UPI003748A1D4